jgi:hypothetical protein
VAELHYKPVACDKPYRLIVVRKNLARLRLKPTDACLLAEREWLRSFQ